MLNAGANAVKLANDGEGFTGISSWIRQLAFRAGLDRTHVSQLENNKKSPTVQTLFRLCGAMKASPGGRNYSFGATSHATILKHLSPANVFM